MASVTSWHFPVAIRLAESLQPSLIEMALPMINSRHERVVGQDRSIALSPHEKRRLGPCGFYVNVGWHTRKKIDE
jgi:hypothetical protein